MRLAEVQLESSHGGRVRHVIVPGAAMSARVARELVSIAVDLHEDRAVRAVVLTSAATDLCTGPADDLDPIAVSPDPAAAFAALRSPVVSVVRGACRSVGFEVVLATDIRITTSSASFALDDVVHGRLPCWGGTQRLARAIRPAAATALVLLGDELDAAQAHELGLVHALATDIEAATADVVDRLAALAPLALELAKEAVHRGAELPLRDGLRLEGDLNHLLAATDDRAEGLAAFFAKRPAGLRRPMSAFAAPTDVADADLADADIGVPSGTAALAVRLAARAATNAAVLTGSHHDVDVGVVLAHLLLPDLVGDVSASPELATAPGGGSVHVDVIDEDRALLAALWADRPDGDAETWARAAQACRLPVTPYRAWRTAPPADPVSAVPVSADTGATIRRRVQASDVVVVDLTAMWAGPLATRLLAAWGATVITIESCARPDGLRGSPAQFVALAQGKQRLDLDLRRATDRSRFERLVRDADVLVESFSPRVLPNWGYDSAALRTLRPRLATVAIRAFDGAAPEAEWVAYGRGVHATSGLGLVGGVPQPARLAYPDPLAGLAAFGTILDLLGRTDPPPHTIVSLAGTIAPLTATGERPLGTGEPGIVDRLRARVGVRPGSPLVRTLPT